MKDESIIELFWSRSERAIAELAAKYGKLVMKIARGILGSKEDAEECSNDTYLGVWNTVPPTKPNSLSAYTARIARNCAVTRRKTNTAQKRGEYDVALDELYDTLAAEDSPEDELAASELARLIDEFLDGEKGIDRELFVRRYYLAEPLFDIACDTGLTKERISVRLTRQRERLRKYLEKEGYDV